LIESALRDSQSVFPSLTALNVIQNMPTQEQGELYAKAVAAFSSQLKRNSLEDPLLALDFLDDLPETYANGLDASVARVIQGAFSSIISNSEEGRELGGHHWRRMMKAMHKLPQEQREELESMAFAAFKNILGDSTRAWNEKCEVFECIDDLPVRAIEELIRLGLRDGEERVKAAATMCLPKLPVDIAQPLETITPITVPESSLYRASDNRGESARPLVSRLSTTGADVYALGGKYQEKVVARDFPIDRYLVWKKAFESYETWQRRGYNYVPIEPIIGVKKIGAGLNADRSFRDLRVFSGFVGITADAWFKKNTRHATHIMNEMTRISAILVGDLKIAHGHPHVGNFGLAFPRKSDGSFDYEQKPRLYLIDFDLAEMIEE
jgi:hypothetical protein